jgi:ketosteroid isomerase-like protein
MRTPLRAPARVWLRVVSAALAFPAALVAQEKSSSTNDEIQVRQLERAWNQAEAHHDVGAVTAIVADTLTYIDFDGSIMNKAEYLRDVTKTAYQADHLYDEGLKVVIYGNAAVVLGIYRETGTSKGKSYTHRVRFTDTWIKQNGVWRCAASQNTLIPNK